jgi:hypothetical protein
MSGAQIPIRPEPSLRSTIVERVLSLCSRDGHHDSLVGKLSIVMVSAAGIEPAT